MKTITKDAWINARETAAWYCGTMLMIDVLKLSIFALLTSARTAIAILVSRQVWERLLNRLGRLPATILPPAAPALLSLEPSADRAIVIIEHRSEPEHLPTLVEPAPLPETATAPELPEALEPLAAESEEPSTPEAAAPTMTVHLLGPFRVLINGRPIDRWPSNRGLSILKYLTSHRAQPILRDMLMDTFWPEATPKSARNSLNVALCGLRRTLRAATDLPIVIFEDNGYGLNPALYLWVDTEAFEGHICEGRRLEKTGQVDAAIAQYEAAVSLYRGDFLVEDLYENWPALTRERLRTTYIDTLDRLSCLYFNREQWVECVRLCRRILVIDNCREDVHCRLMRCLSRANQYPLALRQYQACVEALRAELDVHPAPATIQLAERIRHHEHV